jgi:hypothetical protein
MTSRPVVFLSQIFCLTILFLGLNCHHTTEPPPPSGPDTTSHDFTWTTYDFGEGNPSILWDVAIINDSLAYAVGEIYLKDSLGQNDPILYNLARWNGSTWKISRVYYTYQGSQFISALRAVYEYSATDFWVGSTEPMRWNGSVWQQFDLTSSTFNGYIDKIWGTSSQDVYIVGTHGSIAHYDGSNWQKVESETTTDLQDVWGSSDGNTLWACGYTPDGFHSVLLKCENGQWRTLWTRDGTVFSAPFGDVVGSVWRSSFTYVTTGSGIYRLDNDTTSIKAMGGYPGYFVRMRGNADNDIVAVGLVSVIWHYNGSGWKQIQAGSANQFFESCHMKGGTIIAVGYDSGSFPSRAVIYVGKRK